MVRTSALLWLLAPCGLLAVALNDNGDAGGGMRDQEFVAVATNCSRFEIEAGGLAYMQGSDERIVDYGARMAADDGARCTELAALAALKNWDVPDDLPERESQLIDELAALEGEAFDREFARKMAASHEEAIALFEQASAPGGVQDDELREWAAAKLPVLRSRLQTELDLLGQDMVQDSL
ncbi:DUF4142 domain-containing protein [Parapedobacter deserti]|uniref:DUF4142 domain-containing protein n=1 Tax=Parapedobacter deserti TaxID=1912957 RepID=A0ABV7JM94_9SPHI